MPSSTADAFLDCGLISSWKMVNDKLKREKRKDKVSSIQTNNTLKNAPPPQKKTIVSDTRLQK